MSVRSIIRQIMVKVNPYPFYTLDPKQRVWDQPTLKERIPPKPGPTQRNYDDYIFYTLDPPQKVWDPVTLPPKPGRTQRNYDDYIFFTSPNTQKQSWDNLGRPPKPLPAQRNYTDDFLFTTVANVTDQPTIPWIPRPFRRPYVDDLIKVAVAAPPQTVWDQPTIPPKLGRTQRNYDDYNFFTLNPVQTTWDPQGLPPKPGRTQRNYDDYNFFTLQNTNQQSWDNLNRPTWLVKSSRTLNDDLVLFPIQGWPDDHVYPPFKPHYALTSPADNPAPVTAVAPTYPPIWDQFTMPIKAKYFRGMDDVFVNFVSNVPPPPPLFTPNVRIGTLRGAYLSDPDNPNVGGQF